MRGRTQRAVLAAFTLTVCLLLLSTWLCVRILSGVRAYVGGEGLYSKAQKNAVYFLDLYVHTRNEEWYSKFSQALSVPEGDRDARIALDRPDPDLETARRGFIAGANSPDDVDDLIFVFRRLRRTPYVSAAVEIWTQGDIEISHLRQLGERIHVQQGPGAEDATSSEIEALNRRLTSLEDRFSETLGAGARSTSAELLGSIMALAFVLWGIGVLTSRKLLSALSREHENLRATIDHAPLGIILVDAPEGKLHTANTQARRILGQTPDVGGATIGNSAPRLTWPDSLASKALAGAVVGAETLQWVRPNGSAVWLRMSAAPVWRRQTIIGAVMTFYDISEERKVEERMLSQSQELARSNADLEQFAYISSHDLQEPLRNIANFSQLLSEQYSGRLDQDADNIIRIIIASVERMSSLIHDLLAYSKVNNANVSNMNPVDLDSLVELACSNLSGKITESNALIEAEPLPTVRGDRLQIVQVFQNLIDNAIKYRSAAQPIVRISAEPSPNEHDWTISVRDNGIGIDPQYHDQIFDVFKRLHGREVPGTGIGLALAKRVVQRHGGRIWVEAKAGQGSAFMFTLPAVEKPR